jgi:transposase
MAHVDTRTLPATDLEAIRRRAIEQVLGGMRQAAAAREAGVREATMSLWMQRYRENGPEGLVDRKRGRPRTALTSKQEVRLRKKIEGKTPGQLRLDFALWTTDAILELIHVLYRKRVSKSTVHRLLFSWGFTPKKGTRRAWQQDNVAVAKWTTEEYPAIARRAKRENGRIFWGDETGVRSDDGTTVGWSPKGEPAIMSANGRRWSCNVISAIDNEGGLAFQVFKGGFKVPVFIGFLKRLIEHGKGRKIFLILDQHPVHKSKAVQSWVEERDDEIEIFFMPGYSPELNPDEYLNHDLKSQTVRKRPPEDGAHLISMVRGHLRSRQRTPNIVRNFFRAPFIRYAAAG